MQDGIKSQRIVVDVLAKFRRIATHFGHSVLAKQRLAAIQESLGLPTHSLIQPAPTRWNSSLHMLERMAEQKRAMTVYGTDHGQILLPGSNDWEIVNNLIITLKPFEDITLDISKESASISLIIPSVMC